MRTFLGLVLAFILFAFLAQAAAFADQESETVAQAETVSEVQTAEGSEGEEAQADRGEAAESQAQAEEEVERKPPTVLGVLFTPKYIAFLVVAGVGLVLGIALAVATSRVMSSLLFQIRPTDPATLASVTLLVVTAAVGASYFPARRATKLEPVEVLRRE